MQSAKSQQSVAQQVCNPLGVFDVGLATGHGLDVARVGDNEIEVSIATRSKIFALL